MKYSAFFLVLLWPQLLLSQPSFSITQTQTQDILQTLNEVESSLNNLNQNSLEKDSLISSLETRLIGLQISLTEASESLDESEKSRIKTENLLTEASEALKESEQSFKAYQFWEAIKLAGSFVLGAALGVTIVTIFPIHQ